jgi:hypothetical protein
MEYRVYRFGDPLVMGRKRMIIFRILYPSTESPSNLKCPVAFIADGSGQIGKKLTPKIDL